MSTIHRDYCLSGLTEGPFEDAIRRLFRLDQHIKIVEFLVWDEGGVQRTTFEDGARIGDMAGVVELDFEAMRRCTCVFRPRIAGVTTALQVGVYRSGDGVGIDGMLFVQHLLDHAPSPDRALRELAALLARVAHTLAARVIHMADEDDESPLLPGSELYAPVWLGVYERAVLDQDAIERIEQRGAVVETAEHGAYWLVWMAPVQALVQGAGPGAELVDVLRDRLALARS